MLWHISLSESIYITGVRVKYSFQKSKVLVTTSFRDEVSNQLAANKNVANER
ncbi:hypothetical protein O3G_MSEX011816 [Manduca sexta]|uniref:Uncharacterized protein n=1 Tax=Manduca sexta TaxID=7130 RepID=A0A921ZLD3_MANSE|nr:hypothetical protein O3G_MSEX011816 [Manduca sexta]